MPNIVLLAKVIGLAGGFAFLTLLWKWIKKMDAKETQQRELEKIGNSILESPQRVYWKNRIAKYYEERYGGK